MESYPRPRSPEFNHEPDKEKSETDSKKEKKIGGKVAETIIKPPAEVRGDSLEPKNAESIWQRIAALAEKREIDKSILKPVENADNDSKLGAGASEADKSDKPAADSDETEATKPAEKASAKTTEKTGSAETDEQVPPERLSAEEERETVRRITAEWTAALQDELREAPEGTPPPVESAADLAYLAYVEQQMAESPDKSAWEVLAEAENAILADLSVDAELTKETDSNETGAEADTMAESAEEQAEIPSEGEIPLDARDEEAPIIINANGNTSSTTSPSGSAGGNGNGSGNVRPTPPGANQPPTPPGPNLPPAPGGGSGNGNVPPIPPFRSGMPGPGVPGPGMPPSVRSYALSYPAPAQRFNAAPVITNAELLSERRRAMVQGFLVGGILGYLIGRRRGRIKTEKRLLPIQKKLEEQVKTLAEAVAFKEQAVRKQAAETAAKMQTLDEQKRFAERLAATAEAKVLNDAAKAKYERPADKQSRQTRYAEAGQNNGTPERPQSARFATVLHHEQQQTDVLPSAERLGRMVVEAPVAAVVAAGAIHAGENRGVSAEPIDFGKKVADYTPRELNEAADKIRIDDVTLREIRNEHKLDDTAVRRIITTFVEGGSVREAITRELFEHDLRYEREPGHRQFEADGVASSGGSSDGGGTISAAAATAIGLAAGSRSDKQADSGKDGRSGGEQPHSENRHMPTPDGKTLKQVRNRQIAEVSVATAILLAIVVAIVVLV